MKGDISPAFRWNPYDASVSLEIAKREKNPEEAMRVFIEKANGLTDYSYWFLLSTLWVLEANAIDIETWKKLFGSDRSGRVRSIMKPSEVRAFKQLPYFVTAYRVHRPKEKDWIAYTTKKEIAEKFSIIYGVESFDEYRIKKRDITALFLRREESEIIVLNKDKAEFIRTVRRKEDV